jgi:hypothetical protein
MEYEMYEPSCDPTGMVYWNSAFVECLKNSTPTSFSEKMMGFKNNVLMRIISR